MSSTNANDGECTGAGERRDRDRADPSSTRRRILAGTVTLTGMALAGCLGGDGSGTPSAVAIDADAACDVCGMIISKHPGPNGELYWADLEP
jgi:nitrous oxide reductase accessory protein NosL